MHEYQTSGELKRMRAAEELISKAEMQVTQAVTSKNLTPTVIDEMLNSYLSSLQSTIVRATKGNSNYSAEL